MKKFLCALLCVIMVLSLAACGAEAEKPADDTAPAADTTEPAKEETPVVEDKDTNGQSALGDEVEVIDNTATGEVGMFRPDYDYSANPTYKVSYLVLATGVLYEAFGDAFEHWCGQMNLEYGGLIAYDGDKDKYLSDLTTQCGINDGLLLDADAMQYLRCSEICAENKTPWQSCMSDARDYSAEDENGHFPLLHPYFGFDNKMVGAMMADRMIDNYTTYFGEDVAIEDIGWMCIDFLTSPPLHDREVGFLEQLQARLENIEENVNFFNADTSYNTFDADTSNAVASTVLAQHPEFEYWCIFGETDTQAQGAAIALETYGLEDNGYVVTFGGTGLQVQWDGGVESAWKEACYLPQTIYAEPIICALYAYMTGEATAETIWPEWIDHSDNTAYAKKMLPAFWITHDNYKQVIRWSDIYAGSNYYPDYADLDSTLTRDSFSTKVSVPASYAG